MRLPAALPGLAIWALLAAEAGSEPAPSAVEQDLKAARLGRVDKDASEFGMAYSFLLPKDYDPAKRYPLFVWVHGSGYNGPRAVDSVAPGFSERCIVLGPTRTQEMTDAEAARMLADILARMVSGFHADPDRVVLCGHSWGGNLCYQMIESFPECVAAVAPVYASYDHQVRTKRARPHRLPILILRAEDDIHADKLDPCIASARKDLAEGNYPHVTFREILGTHHSSMAPACVVISDWVEPILGCQIGSGVRLGVTFEEDAPDTGARIQAVLPEGPSARAGLKPGDAVIRMDGNPVPTSARLLWNLANVKPDQKKIVLVVKRKTGTKESEVELAVSF